MESLLPFVTNVDDTVYAIKDTLPVTITSAAMARLSRSPDDLRTILLKEFQPLPTVSEETHRGKEIDLLQQVLSDYGDDSVQQLGDFNVVVQTASNLLTKVLERPRIGAAYLEQSTRWILFDQKVDGKYRYLVPPELDEETASMYRLTMDWIFERYSEIVRKLIMHLTSKRPDANEPAIKSSIRAQACDVARELLPAATTSTVGIHGSAQMIDGLIMHLRAHPLKEARDTGDKMLREVRKIHPVFFERTDMPDRGAGTTEYLREKQTALDDLFADVPQVDRTCSIKLVDYHPINQLDVIDNIIQSYNATPTEVLRKKVLDVYVGNRKNRRHRTGRMFEFPHYTFQFHTNYGEFRDLQRHRLVDAFEWHVLEPRPDFDIPDLIKETGMETLWCESFNVSQQLFKQLAPFGKYVQQYAVLFGNKIDWEWTINLREAMYIIEIRTGPGGHPSYRKLCQEMYAKIEQVHPLLAKTIWFLNNNPPPELTRLESEKAAQAKLQKLENK
jgi:thymidylate synthase ThyX